MLRCKKTLFISGLLDLLLMGEKEFKFSITNVILSIFSLCFMQLLLFEF